MSEVLATAVVEFGDGVDDTALVVVELDDAVNLDDDGKVKTSFHPGDRPAFRVHFDPGALRIDSVECSSGMVIDNGDGQRSATVPIDLDDADSRPELRHIPSTLPAWRWYGNAPSVTNDGRVLTASGALPATGDASYSFWCRLFELVPPPLDDLGDDEAWRIRIVIHMEAA